MVFNIFYELNGEEVADEERNNLLEDTFASSDENGVTNDNSCEIMDLVRDRPHKSKELTDEAMSFITSPKNAKSAKACRRHQNKYV